MRSPLRQCIRVSQRCRILLCRQGVPWFAKSLNFTQGSNPHLTSPFISGRNRIDSIDAAEVPPLIKEGVRGRLERSYRVSFLQSEKIFYCPSKVLSRLNPALISERCVKACGKLPRASPDDPICSAYRPRWFEYPSIRSKMRRAVSKR